MKGRKPKPDHLRTGHKPAHNGVVARAGLPTPPRWLPPAARAEWRRVGQELEAMGTAATADLAVLTSYCTAWAALQAAQVLVNRDGILVETQSGNLIQNPALGVANRSRAALLKFASELGLSPTSRCRIHRTEIEPEVSLEDELLGPLKIAQ